MLTKLFIKSATTRVSPIVVIFLITLFTACGGGGGGGGGDAGTGTNNGGSNGGGSAPPPSSPAPTIMSQPQNQTANDGDIAFFAVTVVGPSSSVTYQWKKNDIDIPGATSASYQIDSVTMADNDSLFGVVVANSGGSVTSAPATLTVLPVPPAIAIQPQAQTVIAGTTATFAASVTGTPPLSFQWRKNGLAISGANTSTYTTPTLTLANTGNSYDVVVTNNQGTAVSQAAALQVTPAPNAVTINAQPTDASATEGDLVSFTVAASGTGPFTYQWFKNGIAIPGGYEQTLTIAPATAFDNGAQLSVTVSNSIGTATSSSSNLTVAKGEISLLLGSAGGWGNINGPAKLARFGSNCGVIGDSAGNYFVSDTLNHSIRKISATETVTTLAGLSQSNGSADGSSANARFHSPGAITIDSSGNLYAVDTANQTVRKITPTGVTTTLAGSAGLAGAVNGTGAGAQFNFEVNSITCSVFGQSGIAMDSNGNIYVADSNNHAIRKITVNGAVTTFAGALGQSGFIDGPASSARFNHPTGIAFDALQNLYVIDRNSKMRKVSPSGEVTTLTGVMPTLDGSLFISANGNFFVTTYYAIFKYDPTGTPTLIAGSLLNTNPVNGIGTNASFRNAAALAQLGNGDLLAADDFGLRHINSFNEVSVFAGSLGLGAVYGFSDGSASNAKINQIFGIAADTAGNVYFTDTYNNTVRKLNASADVSTIAGVYLQPGSADGSTATARFNNPNRIARDTAGNLYVSDGTDHTIRKIANDGTVTTIGGTAGVSGSTDGSASASLFNNPRGIAVDASNNIYVIDRDNFVIRKISNTGVVSTLAGVPGVSGAVDGLGNIARFSNLNDIAIDNSGNLYVSDNFSIRKITSSGNVATFAGSLSTFGTSDGTGTAARFSFPQGIAIDSINNLYVTDGGNNGTIRKITPAGAVTTVAGTVGVWGTQLGALPGSFNNPRAIAIAPSTSGTKLYVSNGTALLLVTLP